MTISVNKRVVHFVLVDYDNLAQSLHMEWNDCQLYINKVIQSLDIQSDYFEGVNDHQPVQILLYGGWYSNRGKTRLAENLVATLAVDVGYDRYKLQSGCTVDIKVKLAYGLQSMRERVFYGTFRRYEPSIKIKPPKENCCDDSRRFLQALREYLKSGECFGCHTDMRGQIYAEGQKMVDTMLACDLQSLAGEKDYKVAVVSSDNDLIPPIFQQSMLSHNVYHVLTKEVSDHCYEEYYYPMCPQNYKQIFFTMGV
ncbi:MAG: hypothetical protein MJZ42_05455 [Bacteroidales bacterium]|nr:hypothetical protein [Bacteroidales bacterium]